MTVLGKIWCKTEVVGILEWKVLNHTVLDSSESGDKYWEEVDSRYLDKSSL